MKEADIIDTTICITVAPRIAAILSSLPVSLKRTVTEIRLRVNLPVILRDAASETMIREDGTCTNEITNAVRISQADLLKTIQMISKNSLYALENELRSGFITIVGGHRVGLAGQALVENGQVKTLKNISSLNIRIARQIKGCADKLMPWLYTSTETYIGGSALINRICSTLIISPPRCGKTTILRDAARQLSSGVTMLRMAGLQVGIVDERSEISACQYGIPAMDLGERCDILDSCPKAEGMLMLIRSMAPQVIITDELGRQEDAIAVEEAIHAGVAVITTAHGHSVEDIIHRPYIGRLIREGCFERYVILGSVPAIGSIMKVVSAGGDILYSILGEVKSCG